jgi:tetratricopeptide (TPR) repeat protein
VRASHARDAALERLDRGALPQAASIAEIAHKRNPLATEPLFEFAAIEQLRGRREQARRALEQAVDLEPANPETWRRLGALRLRAFDDAQGALRAYQAAYYLDPKSARSVLDVVDVARIARGG